MTKTNVPASRHWFIAVLLQIGIRVRYVIESWAGLKTFILGLTAYPSPFRPKNAPKYDMITQLGFQMIWACTSFWRGVPILYAIARFTGVADLFTLFHTWLSKRLEKQIVDSGFNYTKYKEIPMPEYDWKKGPEEFFRLYGNKPHPVVLRGFMNDRKLLKELSWDNVLGKYGEEDVMLTKKELDGVPGKLKEVDNPRIYLHNSEVLFNKYPTLLDLFEFERLEPYLRMKAGYSQIFVGRQGTGSPFHNAAVHNWFYMVDGRKKWYFIDPYDSFLIYPLFRAGKAAAVASCLYPDEYNKAAYPLFKYCPSYVVTLEPGDVLYNPPWWWHGIRNETETTVGVASRWHTDGIAGHKLVMTEENYDAFRFATWQFFIGPSSFNFLHGILQEPSPRFDEHMTLREKNNRYTHQQRKIHEDGGYDVLGKKYII